MEPNKYSLKPCCNCGEETRNPKFCSKSCSAVKNNKLTPKRTRKHKCSKCQIPVISGRKFCKNCFSHFKDWTKIRLCETARRKSPNRNTHIRDLARKKFLRTGYPPICLYCGYDKHFQICHIKPVASFSEDTFISEINDFSNIIPLCPNCHWELDHLNLIIPKEKLDKYVEEISKSGRDDSNV